MQKYSHKEGEEMMRLRLGVLFLLFGSISGAATFAQRASGGPRSWHTGVGLLGYNRVVDELKISQEQLAKIKDIGDEYFEKHYRPMDESIRNLNVDEQRRKLTELEKPQREALDRAVGVLTPEQAFRFLQITIWVNGPFAFTEPAVKREVELTDNQIGTLKAIGNECTSEINALVRDLERDSRGRRGRPTKEEQAKVSTKRKEVLAAKEAECLAVLTDEQKARFEKLKGREFELDPGPDRIK